MNRLRRTGLTDRRRPRDERGYAAVLVAILMPVVFIACAALSVDTARWYVEAGRVQAAADAAALAGVVWMPGDLDTATSTAKKEAIKNGYDDLSSAVVVTVKQGLKASQLKFTISSTIKNSFGSAIGTPRTTITRTAVADYAGGLSMGSPCNVFGSDPDSTNATKSSACDGVGDFWANVGSKASPKTSGDAFQNADCTGVPDGCSASATGPNTDYDDDGYIYTLTTSKAVSNMQVQVFDPGLVNVGDHCTLNNLDGASGLTKTYASDPGTRYASGDGDYCTGDQAFSPSDTAKGFDNQVDTSYTVRYMDSGSDPAVPTSWPTLNSSVCPGAKTYPGYNGDLKVALDKNSNGYQSSVASTFRQWVTLCSSSYVTAGTTISIQVKTNGIGADAAAGHNRFAMRAYASGGSSSNSAISITAFNDMALYANVSGAGAVPSFFLVRVPSSAAGQLLNISLFDIGDVSGGSGKLTFVAPAESGITFKNCRAAGKVTGTVADCTFTADSTFNGRWQSVYITIPKTYTCNDSSATGCWVRMKYDLSGVTQANDTTSWQASIDGQPVRLIS